MPYLRGGCTAASPGWGLQNRGDCINAAHAGSLPKNLGERNHFSSCPLA